MWRADRTELPQREGAAFCVRPEQAPFPDALEAATWAVPGLATSAIPSLPLLTLIPSSDASSAVTDHTLLTCPHTVASASVAAVRCSVRSLPLHLARWEERGAGRVCPVDGEPAQR